MALQSLFKFYITNNMYDNRCFSFLYDFLKGHSSSDLYESIFSNGIEGKERRLEVQNLRNKINRLKDGKGLAKDGYSLLRIMNHFDITVETLLNADSVADLYNQPEKEKAPVSLLQEIHKDVLQIKGSIQKSKKSYSDERILNNCLKLQIGSYLLNEQNKPSVYWLITQFKFRPVLMGNLLSDKGRIENIVLDKFAPYYNTVSSNFYNDTIFNLDKLKSVWKNTDEYSQHIKLDFLIRHYFFQKYLHTYANMLLKLNNRKSYSSFFSSLFAQILNANKLLKKLLIKYSNFEEVKDSQSCLQELPFVQTLYNIDKILISLKLERKIVVLFRIKYDLQYLDNNLDFVFMSESEKNMKTKQEVLPSLLIDDYDPFAVDDSDESGVHEIPYPINNLQIKEYSSTDFDIIRNKEKAIVKVKNPLVELSSIEKKLQKFKIPQLRGQFYTKDLTNILDYCDLVYDEIEIDSVTLTPLPPLIKKLEEEAKKLGLLN